MVKKRYLLPGILLAGVLSSNALANEIEENKNNCIENVCKTLNEKETSSEINQKYNAFVIGVNYKFNKFALNNLVERYFKDRKDFTEVKRFSGNLKDLDLHSLSFNIGYQRNNILLDSPLIDVIEGGFFWDTSLSDLTGGMKQEADFKIENDIFPVDAKYKVDSEIKINSLGAYIDLSVRYEVGPVNFGLVAGGKLSNSCNSTPSVPVFTTCAIAAVSLGVSPC